MSAAPRGPGTAEGDVDPDRAASASPSGKGLPARTGKTNRQLREEAVERMIEAAVTLVATKGAARLSLVEVGRLAGYSHTLPNYYFKSRHELLRCAYARSVGAFRRSTAARRDVPKPPEAADTAVFDTVRAYLRGERTAPTAARAVNLIAAEAVASLPELLPAVRAQNEGMLFLLQGRLEAAAAAGRLRPGLASRAGAVLVLAALRGLMSQQLMAPESPDAAEAAELLCALLGEGRDG